MLLHIPVKSHRQKQPTIAKKHFSFLKCFFFVSKAWQSAAVLLANLLFSSALASGTCWSPEQRLAKVDEWSTVAKIIDGDTIHLQDGRKVRIIGIDTPEVGRGGEASQPFAFQAHKALRKLLEDNKKIALTYDQDKRDRYKRLLAYVTLADGRSVEQELLAQGLAYSIVVPPNARHINCYREIERNARKTRLGLWQLAENQLLEAHHLSSKSTGYRLLSGTVSAYSESKKSIYLKLTAKLSIRVSKKNQQYFPSVKLKSLVGKKILTRGRVNRYKGRQSIHVRSTHDIKHIQ